MEALNVCSKVREWYLYLIAAVSWAMARYSGEGSTFVELSP